MNYEFAFVPEGDFDVVAVVSGDPTYEELLEGRRRLLADPRFTPGVNVLVDHAGLDSGRAPSETLRAMAATATAEWGGAGVGHLVMLAPHPVTFGLLRMWHTYLTDELAARTAVVATREEAHAWLASRLGAARASA